MQVDALTAAGCYGEPYVDHASGALEKRPQLDRILHDLRPGDTLVVWRLDRLGRSLRHLIEVVTDPSIGALRAPSSGRAHGLITVDVLWVRWSVVDHATRPSSCRRGGPNTLL